jgi:NADH dehydrogenase [ubiquinone] 1 alpha subcomplex assembly factor 1
MLKLFCKSPLLWHSPLTWRCSVRSLHTSRCCPNFWEQDRKGGYKTKIELPPSVHIKQGLKQIGKEVEKFKEEVVCHLRCDSIAPLEHGDYEIPWKFDSQAAIDDWVVTADSDHNEGKSSAEFVLSANGRGVFRGRLDTTVPKDGIIKNAGYCNIRSPRNKLSFQRERPYVWDMYTHLLMRVRGDGRTYHIILNMDRRYDVQWNDAYTYALFTRGGPYWQIAKIPFSKFYLGAKGRIQDKQEAVQLDRIATLGITVADSNPGPFQLEIDYVGLLYDSNHTQTFEYEMYPVSPSALY